MLTHVAIGISTYAHLARELGAKDRDIDVFVVQALFSTVTNVNFDPERLLGLIQKRYIGKPVTKPIEYQ
jgi:hydroxylamine reductase